MATATISSVIPAMDIPYNLLALMIGLASNIVYKQIAQDPERLKDLIDGHAEMVKDEYRSKRVFIILKLANQVDDFEKLMEGHWDIIGDVLELMSLIYKLIIDKNVIHNSLEGLDSRNLSEGVYLDRANFLKKVFDLVTQFLEFWSQECEEEFVVQKGEYSDGVKIIRILGCKNKCSQCDNKKEDLEDNICYECFGWKTCSNCNQRFNDPEETCCFNCDTPL